MGVTNSASLILISLSQAKRGQRRATSLARPLMLIALVVLVLSVRCCERMLRIARMPQALRTTSLKCGAISPKLLANMKVEICLQEFRLHLVTGAHRTAHGE